MESSCRAVYWNGNKDKGKNVPELGSVFLMSQIYLEAEQAALAGWSPSTSE
jgi:hypothetical protein